jgi:uncharacterized membrane protein (DUF2068 family)
VIGAMFSGAVLTVLAGFLSQRSDEDAAIGATVLGITGVTLTTLLLAIGIPQLVCGIGLLNFKRWARILGIVLAAISLLNVPIGTIFGIYALVILFSKETEAIFA